jgi:hypothetical protein
MPVKLPSGFCRSRTSFITFGRRLLLYGTTMFNSKNGLNWTNNQEIKYIWQV